MIRDVNDLEVYKEAINLLPELYDLTERLTREEIDLKYQTRRAGKSIAPNISEGFAKKVFEKEFKRYLKIALGSSDEVITHLRIMQVVQPNFHLEIENLIKSYTVLSKRINSLCSHWKSGGSF